MQINPYLFFDSNCEAAFKFYEKVLGGKIELMLRNAEGPPEMGTAPDRMQKIMHARMSFDGEVIMASDAPPSHFQKQQGFAVSITVNDPAEAERKWTALQSFATNRFLWATPLNALQYVMVRADDIQVTRLKTDQTYVTTDAVKPSTNSVFVSRGKPATSREKILLTIEARDSSKNPGDKMFKFQQAITNYPYFKTNLQRVELTAHSPKQETGAGTRPFVAFTFECQFPEKTR